MKSPLYNWRRFWCPRAGHINLSDGGYLYDPLEQWGHVFNPDLVEYEAISVSPCLILLGEPGIGKSHAMRADRDAINKKVEAVGDQAKWVDLAAYGTEDSLRRELFQSEPFTAWLKKPFALYMFLDGLDECRLQIKNVARLLMDELRKHPPKRLYLRIACRTAEWPVSLERDLADWYGSLIGVYELAPLRRVDVREAAEKNEFNPDAFLQEIERQEVVPLAIKPVTLKFLLNTYRKTGQFPSRQKDLYLEGCRALCDYEGDFRQETRLMGDFDQDEKLMIAARIAALMVGSNRTAIRTGNATEAAPGEDLAIKDVCGGKEPVNRNGFPDEVIVSKKAVEEVLDTGLFTGRGVQRLGWAHHSYAEFLAALYFERHQMEWAQIKSLIYHPDGKLVPQLHGTAAWLASSRKEIFAEIMRTDPEVLLQSDIATADVRDRENLVDTLLRLYEEGKLLDYDFDNLRRYRKLAHPNLARQLKPYLRGGAKGEVVRRVAIDVAETCIPESEEIKGLQEDLADLALDASQPLPVRVQSAFAISRVGDDQTKMRFKPLAMAETSGDQANDLKGCALFALWPDQMSAEELFTLLAPPKPQSPFGIYRSFLSSKLAERIRPTDLPRALTWVKREQAEEMIYNPYDAAMDSLIKKAWEHLEVPGVLEAFVRVILFRLRHQDDMMPHPLDPLFERLLPSDEKRRLVLEVMVSMVSPVESHASELIKIRDLLVQTKDIPWMIKQMQSAGSMETARVWAHLIRAVFDEHEPGQVDLLLTTCKDSPALAEAFAPLITPVELNSRDAQVQRAQYDERQKRLRRRNSEPSIEPPLAERVAALLSECESGNLSAWWDLTVQMQLETTGREYENPFKPDVTSFPGWRTADPEARQRILAIAKRFIREQDPDAKNWLGMDHISNAALAGYKALRLLWHEDPVFISDLSVDVWRKWAPAIIGYPIYDEDDKGVHQKMINSAYQFAVTETIDSLMIIIDAENKKHEQIFIVHRVEGCWDDRLAQALLAKATDNTLKPTCMGSLLKPLISRRFAPAKPWAESLISIGPAVNDKDRAKAIIAAQMVMGHAEDAGWSIVWPVIQRDVPFGRQVVEGLSYLAERPDNVRQRLKENELADLYIWLAREYPHAEDPQGEGAVGESGSGSAIRLRDSLLTQLKQCGTYEACEAIRRIIGELPNLDWLKWTLLEAQTIARRQTWKPPEPIEILKLADNRRARLVQTGEQLLDVLLERFKHLEEMLMNGTPPAAQFLWDKKSKKRYRPKDEESLSDFIKLYLDQFRPNAIVINREVQIRRGQKTDLYIQAQIPGTDDTITVVIEVKGCWHRELNSAMQTQLVDRYLTANGLYYGIYVVGWYHCDGWDPSDSRHKVAKTRDLQSMRNHLERQAAELSNGSRRVKALVLHTALDSKSTEDPTTPIKEKKATPSVRRKSSGRKGVTRGPKRKGTTSNKHL